MQKKIVTRCLSAAGVFVIIAFAGVASSVAAIPDNDNFANATIISALPFSDSGNLTGTAMEPGEPQFCNFLTQTVWYRLTPTTNKTIKVKLTGSDDSANFSVYQTGGVGAFGLNFLGCAGGSTGSFQLDISAGSTYYIQAGSAVFGAHLQIGIDEILPPSNDNFAAATPIQAIPFIDIVDLTRATVESLEPVQPTPFDTIVASAWYAVSPAVSQSLTVSAANTCCTSPFIAVFTGGSLPTLTRVNASSSPGQKVTFRADAGTTYFIQLGRAFMSLSAVMTFRVESTPPPVADFAYFPSDASVFDLVNFFDHSSDPGQVGFQPPAWNFGDGTQATGAFPTHRYATDGDYTVTLVATTLDGRTASASHVISVRTHDVAITKLAVPNAAGAGQTRHLTVGVSNNRDVQLVQVTLFKSVPGGFDGFQLVGTLTQQVASVTSGNRTTSFDFSYTITDEDAVAGKVTFKAVAAIQGARDAQPADNTAIAPPTKVNP